MFEFFGNILCYLGIHKIEWGLTDVEIDDLIFEEREVGHCVRCGKRFEK